MEEKKYKVTDGVVVARVRATRKGKTLTAKGMEKGGKGVDGRKWYHIRKVAKGIWTCDCMSYRFKKGPVGKKFPCKHMMKLFHDCKDASSYQCGVDMEILIPNAL